MSLYKSSGASRILIRFLSSSPVRKNLETPEKLANLENRPTVPTNAKRQTTFAPARLGVNQIKDWEMERLRVVPRLNTFYGGNPVHDDNMNKLNDVVNKYRKLPTRVLDEREVKQFKFVSFEDYKKSTESGSRLKIGHHKELLEALHRLRSIEPELMPKEVIDTLEKYSSQSAEARKGIQQAIKTLDEFGRANTVGKRKRSSASVSLVRGQGEVLVNGRPFVEYFARDTDRAKIGYPFQVVGQEGQYNVFVTTNGGGISGQAEAAMYGIAKALVVFNPLLKPRLRLAGLMTRDPRKVERKKPGKVKARKSPTWVKR